MNETNLIEETIFSPKIKTYIFLSVGFFLLITIIGIPFLVIWILGLGQYVSKRYYDNLKCRLTTRHLIFSKGAFFMVEKTIPLENIQDLTFLRNPILDLLELRVLKIETAGSSNPHGSDMKLIGIVQADLFKQKVLEQRELLLRKPENDHVVSNEDESLQVLREIRDLLKEFKSKKP